MTDITITIPNDPHDPRDRVLAIEVIAHAICEHVGEDAADGTMMLLTAAAHIAMQNSDKPIERIADVLARCLGEAIVAAEGFFGHRRNRSHLQ